MAIGDSIVSVCNIAMVALGEDLIVSVFPPDNTKRAILAAQRYDDVRRGVLASYPWHCNRKRAQLAAAVTAPLFGAGAQYPLPADCLGVDELPGIGRERWIVEGGNILTNAGGPLNVIYGFDLQDPSRFEPLLTQAVGYGLAAELCEAIAQSRVERDDLLQILAEKIATARFTSSRSASARALEIDVWLSARR
jgi:hypothetical protein